MLNLLEHYIDDSVPRGVFTTNSSLSNKVDPDGSFRPFFGSTVVFSLDGRTKFALAGLQRGLYCEVGHMLAQPLNADTFHMTLHDLVNGSAYSDDLVQNMVRVKAQVLPLLQIWQNKPPLQMRATRTFNLVHTSVVLGLEPSDADSWRQLDRMYQELEAVVPLGYGLTPHITLAYYKPGYYSEADAARLRTALGPSDLELLLPMQAMTYQSFWDMNHYREEVRECFN